MASDDQVVAARFLAAHSGFHVKRTTEKAVILHCSDPNIRIRVGARVIWRQHRITMRDRSEWVNSAQLRLSVKELARRGRAAAARQAQAANPAQ